MPEVLGWHLAVLNVNAVCEVCNAIVAKGTRGAIGIVNGGGPIPIRCEPCLEELVHDESADPDE